MATDNLERIRLAIADRSDEELHCDLDAVQEDIDRLLEAEENGADIANEYAATCLVSRELTAEGIRRGLIQVSA